MTRPIATLFILWIALPPSIRALSADGAEPEPDWLPRAREQAQEIEVPAARAKLFGRIAVASARLGDEAAYRRDIARAKEAMAAAPATMESSPVDSAVVQAVPALIAARARAGDLQGAKDLAEEHLKGLEPYRSVWMTAICAAEAEAGDLDGALATVNALNESGRPDALVQVSAALARRDDPRAARVVGMLGDDRPTRRSDALRTIALAQAGAGRYAEAGRLDAARRTADSIPAGERERREAFHVLALALARAGDLDAAVGVADDQSEVEWLADIASFALDGNRRDEARRLVDRLREVAFAQPKVAGPLVPRLAVLEARLGGPMAPNRLAAELDGDLRAERDAGRRHEIEATLLGLYVNAGRMGNARRVVRGKPAQDVDTMISWAVSLSIASGDLKGAEELTFLLPTPGSREPYVVALAVAHRKKAGARGAATWIDQLPAPHDRAAAYLGLGDPILSR